MLKSFEIEGKKHPNPDYLYSLVLTQKVLRDQLTEIKIKIALIKASMESSKKATDARYKTNRQLLVDASTVARQRWEGGSILLHHQMKKFLIEEYQDEIGKYPFLSLPDKSLLETCKRVAKEMNRPDLISGQKKSS